VDVSPAQGSAFSDGHPITSEDVLFSFAVAYDETLHPAMQDLLKIGGKPFNVSAPDPHTVVIDTLKPNSALLDALCQGGLPILPKHVLEAAFKAGTFASAYNVGTPVDQIIGGGAWRVARYVPGSAPCSPGTRTTTASIRTSSGCRTSTSLYF
jgi:ABC-type transport system substrate-binding protein